MRFPAMAMTAVAVVALGACGTRYQDMGFTGGVAAEQMTTDTFRITARGNGYTGNTTIQDYALLKAAETTKEAGGTHFLVISAADASRVVVGQTASTMQTSVIGQTAFTTYNPGSTYTIIKPGEQAYIRVLRLRPGEAPPAGALSADEIIQYIGPRVKRAT